MKRALPLIWSLFFFHTTALAGENQIDNPVKQCSYPQQPVFADDLMDSEEKLLNAQKKVKAYMKQGNEYLACIKRVESSWGEDVTQEQRQAIAVIHNNVIDNMYAIADYYNSIVRGYKEKTQ